MARDEQEESERPLKVVTIRIFNDNAEYLKVAYPHGGYNRIIRALVDRHCNALRNRTIERIETKLSEEELNAV